MSKGYRWMNGVQAWGSVKAHIIIVCERFGHICVNRWGVWKAVTQEKRLNLPSLFPFALHNQEKKPLLKFNLESYRYKRLDSGVFRWPRNEMEARLLTEQEIRWLLEGLELEQPKAIKESKPGILY